MKVFIRADASDTLGSGHIMRCLALAEEISGRGGEVIFVCSENRGNLIDIIKRLGFESIGTPAADKTFNAREDARRFREIVEDTGGADWLITDRHGINLEWDEILRPAARRIMAIDDLAQVERDCDILVNQNYLPGIKKRYERLVPEGSGLYLGPAYALLRKEFREGRKMWKPSHSGKTRRILIFFGGGIIPARRKRRCKPLSC